MRLTPDDWIFFHAGFLKINATIAFTWAVISLISAGSWLATRKMIITGPIPRWQNALEIVVTEISSQIANIGISNPTQVLPYIGTLFLFISISNICAIFPYFEPPTGSLSTTAALATSVFFAVPIFGISENGIKGYLKHYSEPTPLMIPFHILSEFSRTVALTVRIFGNVMSGTVILAILISIVPLFFPIVISIIGLITGVVQAYIFSILATVFISAGIGSHNQ